MKKIFLILLIFSITSIFGEECRHRAFWDFYGKALAGWNFAQDIENEGVTIDFDGGFIVGCALGCALFRFTSLEAEFAYRENKFHHMRIEDINFPLSGKLRKLALMANALIRIPLLEGDLIPYFGGGVGQSWDRGCLTINPIPVSGGEVVFEDISINQNSFAYQVIAGVSLRMARKVFMDIEYRYLDGPDTEGNHTFDFGMKRFF